jgi:hypothetical protein
MQCAQHLTGRSFSFICLLTSNNFTYTGAVKQMLTEQVFYLAHQAPTVTVTGALPATAACGLFITQAVKRRD